METHQKIIRTISVSALRANILTIAIFLPFYFIVMYIFICTWSADVYHNGIQVIFQNKLIFILIFIIGVVVHELLHGITWAFFATNGLKSIKFGMKWLYLMPYCHCSSPMKRNSYILGGIMPGLVLGVIPMIIGLAQANAWLTILGVIFTGAAGGDLIVLIKLLKIDKNCTVQDHPDEIGFIVRK